MLTARLENENDLEFVRNENDVKEKTLLRVEI